MWFKVLPTFFGGKTLKWNFFLIHCIICLYREQVLVSLKCNLKFCIQFFEDILQTKFNPNLASNLEDQTWVYRTDHTLSPILGYFYSFCGMNKYWYVTPYGLFYGTVSTCSLDTTDLQQHKNKLQLFCVQMRVSFYIYPGLRSSAFRRVSNPHCLIHVPAFYRLLVALWTKCRSVARRSGEV